MTLEEWLEYGWLKGWCSPPVCEVHDGVPSTEEEDDALMYGEDPCIHIVRLYDSPDTAQEVASNHSPTVWRAKNFGWPTNQDLA